MTSTFTTIDVPTLAQNGALLKYLSGAHLRATHKGEGTYVKAGLAPTGLGEFGIRLERGGMIIPDMHPFELHLVIAKARRDRFTSMQELIERELGKVFGAPMRLTIQSVTTRGIPHASVIPEDPYFQRNWELPEALEECFFSGNVQHVYGLRAFEVIARRVQEGPVRIAHLKKLRRDQVLRTVTNLTITIGRADKKKVVFRYTGPRADLLKKLRDSFPLWTIRKDIQLTIDGVRQPLHYRSVGRMLKWLEKKWPMMFEGAEGEPLAS